MAYKFLEHTADIKVLVNEKNLDSAFCTSARALKEIITDDLNISEKFEKKFIIKAKDRERLLYDFLEEFLYLLDAKNFIFSKITKIKIIKNKKEFVLKVNIVGDKLSNYKLNNNVKAITYSEMIIKEIKSGIRIQFIVDV